MTYPKVSIIILNWNGLKDTIECLEYLKKITYPNYEVIVVDNGSDGNDADILEEKYKGYIKVIRNKENLGFAEGNNVAIEYALQEKYPPDYIFLLNNDAKVEQDCLTTLVDVSCKADAGIVGAGMTEGRRETTTYTLKAGLIRQFFAPIVREDVLLPAPENEFWPSFWVCGGAMLIRREVLSTVYSTVGRYLNSELFLYFDEMDFCVLASKLGHKTVLAMQAIVYHKPAQTTGGHYNPIPYYYITRNRLLLAKELLPMRWKVLFHPVNVLLCLARVLKNVGHRRFNSAQAILCGLIDGYRGITGKWKHHDREALRWHRSKEKEGISLGFFPKYGRT